MQAKNKKKKSSKHTVRIHETAQGSPEWFDLRKGRVTASNAWKMLERGYKYATEQKPIATTSAMQRGKDLEPEALELYSKIKNDLEILSVGFVTNSKYPNAGASPDGVLPDKLLEVKCFGRDKHLGITEDNIPPEVMAQVQMQMMICELPECDLVLYNPQCDPADALRIITIPADPLIHKNLAKHLQDGLDIA